MLDLLNNGGTLKYLLILCLLFVSCTTFSIDKLGGWETYSYENITIVYRKENYSNKSSPSIQFIKGLAEEQISAIHKAEQVLKEEIRYPIKIYLYNQDEEQVKSNPYGGRAEYQQKRIMYSYNESDVYRNTGDKVYIGYHEIAHVIFGIKFMDGGVESNRLITEGLAVWFDDGYQVVSAISKITKAKTSYKKSLDSWISQYSGIIPSLQQVIDEQYTMKQSLLYPVSGMFIKYLIDKYGFDIVRILYNVHYSDLSEKIQTVLGKNLEEVDKDFNLYLLEYSNNNVPLYL